jgi:hypothetical protein
VKSRIVNFAAECFLWTLLAFFVEVCVTATVERLSLGSSYMLAKTPWFSLQGHTTIWDLVDGLALAFSARIVVRFFHHHRVFARWWARGLLTIPLIYVFEFLGGLFFNKLLKFDLWDYSQYVVHGVPLHLMGQITLVYAPFWFLAGVFMPVVYRMVHAVAPYAEKRFERLLTIDART